MFVNTRKLSNKGLTNVKYILYVTKIEFTMSAPANFCRICFRNNNLLRKLHELDIDGIRLSDKLKSCVPEIIYTEELEKYESICIECCQFLKTAYMFKELCIRSNILLQGCLWGQKQMKPVENSQKGSYGDQQQMNLIIDEKIGLINSVSTKYDTEDVVNEIKRENNEIIIKEENISDNEEVYIKEANLAQFVNTYLSDSSNSGAENSKKSSIHGSIDSTDTTHSMHLKNLIHAAKSNNFLTDLLPTKAKGEFSCEICGKRFIKKAYLNKHTLIHKLEKPYVCYLCNMSFCRKNTLDTHLLVHTGVKKHVCNVCGKSFRLKCALDRHTLIHSDFKAFKCKICGKGFGRKDHLEKHGRVHRHLFAELTKLQDKQFV